MQKDELRGLQKSVDVCGCRVSMLQQREEVANKAVRVRLVHEEGVWKVPVFSEAGWAMQAWICPWVLRM